MTKPEDGGGASPGAGPDFYDPGSTDVFNIDFVERENSPRLSMQGDQLVGTRIFQVDWSDMLDFLDELYGVPGFFADGFPEGSLATFPKIKYLVATDYEASPYLEDSPQGKGDVTGLSDDSQNQYDSAVVTVHYHPFLSLVKGYGGPKMPAIPNGTLLTYTRDTGVQHVSLPGRYMFWKGTTTQLDPDVTAGLVLPTGDFVFHWHRVFDPPFDQIDSQAGTVNDSPFMGLPAGTVLFMGAKPVPLFLSSGMLWNLEYRFKYRAIPDQQTGGLGWNFAYRRDNGGGSGGWKEIIDSVTGQNPIVSSDFDVLFQFQG